MTTLLKKEIPIVFAVDNNYSPFLGVTIESIVQNASKEYFYSMYVLTTGISKTNMERISAYNSENVRVEFIDVTKQLDKISGMLHLRDYYTNTTYYRFFIPSLFPQYSKALYLDCDIVVLDDISKLYNQKLGHNLVAAIQEEVMDRTKVFGDYVEQALDIPVKEYFSAGIMVMNLDLMRKEKLDEGFVSLIKRHKFEVTQDQDYLNVLCQGRTKLLSLGWNKAPIKNKFFNDKNLKLVHYKMAMKPWHYDGLLYGDYFWKYAKCTPYYQELIDMKNGYTDEMKKKDDIAYERLVNLAIRDINDENNYKRCKERLQEYEISRAFEGCQQNCRI